MVEEKRYARSTAEHGQGGVGTLTTVTSNARNGKVQSLDACHWDSRGRACFCYFNCPGLCAKRSNTWSGWCASSNNCDKQCRTKEGANHGACHGNILKRACDCYFKC
uniref:Defensin-like protein 19 n=1 Tax=Cajanus cajan TaxID=3821 RepID=A0A151U9E6_CAJCA|nr:Defensin-like protein 19 [Cajanus cajan]